MVLQVVVQVVVYICGVNQRPLSIRKRQYWHFTLTFTTPNAMFKNGIDANFISLQALHLQLASTAPALSVPSSHRAPPPI